MVRQIAGIARLWNGWPAGILAPGHAMAFDLKRNALVLFGGLGQGSVALGDTWEHVE